MGFWSNKLVDCNIYKILKHCTLENFKNNSNLIKECYAISITILEDAELLQSIVALQKKVPIKMFDIEKCTAPNFASIELTSLEPYLYLMQYGISKNILNIKYSHQQIAVLFKFIETAKKIDQAILEQELYQGDIIHFFNAVFAEQIISLSIEELNNQHQNLQCFDYIFLKTAYIQIIDTINIVTRLSEKFTNEVIKYFSVILKNAHNIHMILMKTEMKSYYNNSSLYQSNLIKELTKMEERYKIIKKHSTDQEQSAFITNALNKMRNIIPSINIIHLTQEEMSKYQESINYIQQNLNHSLQILQHDAAHIMTDAIKHQSKKLLLQAQEILISTEISTSTQIKTQNLLEEYKKFFTDKVATQMMISHFSDFNIYDLRATLNLHSSITREISLKECVRSIIHLQKFILSASLEAQEEINASKILSTFQDKFHNRLHHDNIPLIEICETLIYVCYFSFEMLDKEKEYYSIPSIIKNLILRSKEITENNHNIGEIFYIYHVMQHVDYLISTEERFINQLGTFIQHILAKKDDYILNKNYNVTSLNEGIFYLEQLITLHDIQEVNNIQDSLNYLLQTHKEVSQQNYENHPTLHHNSIQDTIKNIELKTEYVAQDPSVNATSNNMKKTELEKKESHDCPISQYISSKNSHEIALEFSTIMFNENLYTPITQVSFNEEIILKTIAPQSINKLLHAELLMTDLPHIQNIQFQYILKMFISRCNTIVQNSKSNQTSNILTVAGLLIEKITK